MKLPIILRSFIIMLVITYTISSYSQITSGDLTEEVNNITTAVPFLRIAQTAESGSFGDISVVNPQRRKSGLFGNPALLVQDTSRLSVSISYTPWLRNLIPDIYLSAIGASYSLSKRSRIGMNFIYFSLGNITFTDIVGNTTGQFNANELSPSISYSYGTVGNWSIGARIKYIYSDLTGGQFLGGMESNPGQAGALDIGITKEFGFNSAIKHQFGVNIENIGNKISYQKNSDKKFLPINLSVGYMFKVQINSLSFIGFAYEANKMLVPTPPAYYNDSLNMDGGPVIRLGYDPNVSVPLGMIRSFFDAPAGIQEEFNEITHSFGLFYTYNWFDLRFGYFHEHVTKGNRKYFTTGIGINMQKFNLHLAYLVPILNNNPLANTLRFSIGFYLD